MSEHIVGVEPKVYNGRKYRSTLEARTAETLDKMGFSWEYETKKYILQESFYSQYQKRKVDRIEYIPDFIIGPVMIEMKGFETPDWKIKKKIFFKYLKENEPDAIWYMCKNTNQLLQALDNHLSYLGYCIKVTPQPKGKKGIIPEDFPLGYKLYDSIKQAQNDLKLDNKSITPIIRSLTGKKEFVYNYNWQLQKVKL